MIGSAAAAPITLDVSVTQGLLNSHTDPAFAPQSFQLTITPDPTVTQTIPPSTANTVTMAETIFGAPTFSATPFTASLLAANTLGALSDVQSQTSETDQFIGLTGASSQIVEFRRRLTAEVVSGGTTTEFIYQLAVTGGVNGMLHSGADVVQPTANALFDVFSASPSIGFEEFEETNTFVNGVETFGPNQALDGTATIDTGNNNAVPEPSSIALFATALFGLSWLARRKPS